MKIDFKNQIDIITSNPELSRIRPVVEKEIMHYEIFYALDKEGLLKDIVFQGGTSLRLCRGSDRFSEDLDFAGGRSFSAQQMSAIKDCIEKSVAERFGLKVEVKEPKKDKGDAQVQVDKWLISIETSPGRPDMPRQKIKLEIANVEAYTKELVAIRINYPHLEGMERLLVHAESIDEILADKIVALPTSISKINDKEVIMTPTRVRHRDIWDISWLLDQGAEVDLDLIEKKVDDYGIENYSLLLEKAKNNIEEIARSDDFKKQMMRFVKKSAFEKLFNKEGYEKYFSSNVISCFNRVLKQKERKPK